MNRALQGLKLIHLLAALALVTGACSRSVSGNQLNLPKGSDAAGGEPTRAIITPPAAGFTFEPPDGTPTPDVPRILPTIRAEDVEYQVRAGDSLGAIAERYGIGLKTVIEANGIENPDLIEPGQLLFIPAPEPMPTGPGFKIIPDSELVRGPASASFNVEAFLISQGGYLSGYSEEVDEEETGAAEIIERVGREYSVNPRLLLALIEYQSSWVTDPEPEETAYPLGFTNRWYNGLYKQLSWAANRLNYGYYAWQLNAFSNWLLVDGSVVPPDSTINAGTAALQYLFAPLYSYSDWLAAVGEQGLFATYYRMFGYPFDYAVNNLVPEGLTQPEMQLPFQDGEVWSFTGGPHGGWGSGSGWAALDFAPPGEPMGCVISDYWTTAVADGVITYSDHGTILLDLDGDGYDQTGWSVLYLHIDSEGRLPAGTRVKAGDPIGRPSCEGGVSNGTHVHLARRYNGVWIPADGAVPFNLDGWISAGTGTEYNGVLVRNGQTVEAWDRRTEENQIQR